MEQNKIHTYLLYALGEIALVMIGILLALQVNNWNEERKVQDAQEIYMSRLLEDMEGMISDYEGRYLHSPESVKEAKEALIFVNQCGSPAESVKSLDSTLITHQTMMMYTSNSGTYREMLSNGSFASLPNEDLKTAVNRLYSSLDFGMAQVNYFRDEVGRAGAIIWEHADFSYDAGGEPTVSYSLEELCESRTLKNALAELVDARSDWESGRQMYLLQMKNVAALLRSELDYR